MARGADVESASTESNSIVCRSTDHDHNVGIQPEVTCPRFRCENCCKIARSIVKSEWDVAFQAECRRFDPDRPLQPSGSRVEPLGFVFEALPHFSRRLASDSEAIMRRKLIVYCESCG